MVSTQSTWEAKEVIIIAEMKNIKNLNECP